MEKFDQGKRNVKEKSVYLLHLDTPRIILIISVIIGIVAGSFLIGMNFVKDDNSAGMLSDSEVSFDKSRELQMIDNKIDEISGETKKMNPGNAAIPDLTDDKNFDEPSLKNELNAGKELKKSGDILTSENMKNLISPAVGDKQEDIKRVYNRKPAKNKKITKRRKRKKKTVSKHVRKRSRVVEVARRNPARHLKPGYFSVQVAAYDKKSKARREINILKSMNYDAHISNKVVNGKRFYRVKVGPISSKRKAIKLLNEIQDIPKYSASYIVRE